MKEISSILYVEGKVRRGHHLWQAQCPSGWAYPLGSLLDSSFTPQPCGHYPDHFFLYQPVIFLLAILSSILWKNCKLRKMKEFNSPREETPGLAERKGRTIRLWSENRTQIRSRGKIALGHEGPMEQGHQDCQESWLNLRYDLIIKLLTFDINFLQQLVWLAAEKCVAH